MSHENDQCCRHCKYWRPDRNAKLYGGECWRHAPRVFQLHDGGEYWTERRMPRTEQYDACGDFRSL